MKAIDKDVTHKYQTLYNHIVHKTSGRLKSVCVSTCLNFFEIPFDSYQYTGSVQVPNHKAILRRFKYSVRSRKSEFKVPKNYRMSLTKLKANIRKSNYKASDLFVVNVSNKRASHLIVLNGNGNTIIDTARGSRWCYLVDVSLVEPTEDTSNAIGSFRRWGFIRPKYMQLQLG